MRLRYLHLPDYGVLKDIKIAFDRENILERRGSLQFVVGLNGTGKSSLLRAIYEVFRCLEEERVPPFPICLAYEIDRGLDHVMVLFRHMGKEAGEALFSILSPVGNLEKLFGQLDLTETWNLIFEMLPHRGATGEGKRDWSENPFSHRLERLIYGDELVGNQVVREHLPNPLLTYTSGDLTVWLRASENQLPEDALDEIALRSVGNDEDRPRGWDIHRELSAVDVELTSQQRNLLREQVEPGGENANARCLLLPPIDLKLAAVTVGLVLAAKELGQYPTVIAMQDWRTELLKQVHQQQRGKRPADKDARTLLNEVDWWWPTHLSITYKPYTGRMNPEWHAQWLMLCALADEVIHLPLGRMQMVINLGIIEKDRTSKALQALLLGEESEWPDTIRTVADRVEGQGVGAAAVTAILSTRNRYEDRLWDVFRTLQAWRISRLLEDTTVTVKRISPMNDHSDSADDVVLTWDDFSDGEQMLLGRMALLLLLRGRDGSMLLLDEPETHFNDSWKREIIDIVDDNVLKDTAAQVLVATHTSIALTDAFAREIVRLVREDGQARVKPVSFPTFGAEPGRVMLHVFEMAESIGSRSGEVLKQKLAEKWDVSKRDNLEQLVAKIGGGWPRARLQQLLNELSDDSSSS